MNKYVKMYLHRGLIFGGFGPVVVGIVFAILEATVPDFSLGGGQVLLAIVSTYLLAFIQAGGSVFSQIEHWSIARSLSVHFLTLYLSYVGCYLLNSWIPYEPLVIVIFSAIFVVTYFVIWLSVYLAVKTTQKRLNERVR